jgi:hypothetical protein
MPTVNIREENGNIVGLTSDALMSDGTSAQLADVWFEASLTDPYAVVEALEDVLARYSSGIDDPLISDSAEMSGVEPDVSLALSSELQIFDQAGVEVDLTKGLSLVVATVGPQVTDPDEILRRAKDSAFGSSLGQT